MITIRVINKYYYQIDNNEVCYDECVIPTGKFTGTKVGSHSCLNVCNKHYRFGIDDKGCWIKCDVMKFKKERK